MFFREPTLEDYDNLKEYVQELKSLDDAEGTNGLYFAIYNNYYDKWLNKINNNSSKTFLIVVNDKIVGIINIRYVLSDVLKKCGGNIGYNIRPSERRNGYASQALKLSLEHAYEYGLENLYVDTFKNNIASIKTIEACGGNFLKEEFIEERDNIVVRYEFDLIKKFTKERR